MAGGDRDRPELLEAQPVDAPEPDEAVGAASAVRRPGQHEVARLGLEPGERSHPEVGGLLPQHREAVRVAERRRGQGDEALPSEALPSLRVGAPWAVRHVLQALTEERGQRGARVLGIPVDRALAQSVQRGARRRHVRAAPDAVARSLEGLSVDLDQDLLLREALRAEHEPWSGGVPRIALDQPSGRRTVVRLLLVGAGAQGSASRENEQDEKGAGVHRVTCERGASAFGECGGDPIRPAARHPHRGLRPRRLAADGHRPPWGLGDPPEPAEQQGSAGSGPASMISRAGRSCRSGSPCRCPSAASR